MSYSILKKRKKQQMLVIFKCIELKTRTKL